MGKIKWETTVEGKKATTETGSDEMGWIDVKPFPKKNSSFGPNTIIAKALIDTTPPRVISTTPKDGQIIEIPQGQDSIDVSISANIEDPQQNGYVSGVDWEYSCIMELFHNSCWHYSLLI